MTNTIVRFPPSPTGFLHIGNARIAIINWLFAKKNNGKILLRFDDTDLERSKDEFKVQMQKDLDWLKIGFDGMFLQSERVEVYKEAFNKLLQNNYIYPCYETEEELEIKRKVSLSSGNPPIYKRPSTLVKIEEREPYFRFHLTGEQTEWEDEIQGNISYQVKDLSDPVILRANGNFMYTFCSVVDDFLTNVSHIIRGADHITNTAIQIQIFNALEKCYKVKKEIKFAHLPLFQGKEGKISKRVGGFSIMEMRESGYEPEAILNLLSKIGLSYYDDNPKSIQNLIDEFDLKNFNKSQITFDFHLMELFNKKLIANMKFSEVKSKINPNITESFFENIKHNITFVKELDEWYEIFYNENLTFTHLLSPEEQDFIKNFFTLLKKNNILNWEDALKMCKTHFPERKGKALFLPIRIALTGKSFGPEMHFIFSEINQKKGNYIFC